ncbi:adenylate kinase family protein [Sporobolomyces koalae]|uniref:adenylate kinase family protein n=1 Tax=Sporobolomyces koalae TaxID=500713 RepID=UPI00316DBBFA
MILLGAPGAGKGTQSDWLLQKWNIETIVVGQLLRNEIVKGSSLGAFAEKKMKAGELIADDIVLDLVQPEVEKLKDKHWILDGFPRKASQAVLLDKLLAKDNESLNFVASLQVPDEVILKRIEERFIHLPSGRTYNLSFNPPQVAGKDDVTGEPLSQRPDDNATTFAARLKSFHFENDPLLAHYDGAVMKFVGKSSKEIWPKLEKAIEERFPSLQRR